jgi:alpha-1,6-mannosyltransferase
VARSAARLDLVPSAVMTEDLVLHLRGAIRRAPRPRSLGTRDGLSDRGMRIADVAEFYAEAGGGVKTYIDAKLRAAAARGHELTVVAPRAEPGEEARDGGRVVWVKGPPVPGDRRYALFTSERRVHAVLDRVRPDVLEGSSPWGGGRFAATWPHARARAFVFHQDPVAALAHPLLDRAVPRDRIDRLASPLWRWLRRLAGRYDRTVVAGRWLAERLRGFGIANAVAVPFGVDPAPFRAARRDEGRRRAWLARAGLEPEAALLVAVSRHHPEKRLPCLIEAVRRLDRPAALVVFGDGPARRAVERAAGSEPRVMLAGYTRDRDELAQDLASADAFLHGSAAETFGLVVSEALSAGLPLVVPNEGGAAEVAHPDIAETYPPGDAVACARAIGRLLDRDRDALAAAVRVAGGRVRTLDAHFDELFALFAELAAPRA